MRVELAKPLHVDGLCALFASSSCGCFCRFWHFEGEDNDWLSRCAVGDNRAEFVAAAEKHGEDVRGMVALIDDNVVGWLKLSSAPAMKKLASRRVYRTLAYFDAPRTDTAVIACVLVHPASRSRGVARALVAAAVDAARAFGASAIEAFPRVADHALREDELQMGPVAIYRSLGFVIEDGPTPYPFMRLGL